ncbi:hypothetical protein M3A96_09845 [Helcobacillus massiliensis]|uniref:hypothetical protein n=1 Tax=Helcobacillus massiliensis TaxID=521392 RepID=UPI0021A80579|nr:hypothetical protein [Helcobacillus massiliensis]MCT1558414.1 hypothetical protein [Helcobacillus massiliensis]MCT2332731.1 hypothetical protein [Helcobacillus massiliensis]
MTYTEPAQMLDLSAARPAFERLTAFVKAAGAAENASTDSSAATDSASAAGTVPGAGPQLIDPDETAAQIPPVLQPLVDEFAGIHLDDDFEVNLVIDERTDLGPYTLLGDTDEYYPLFETADEAIIVTIADNGNAGGVWYIDEELGLHLLATSLPAYLETVGNAIAAVGSDSGERVKMHLLSHAVSTVNVLNTVEDLDARVQFSEDGQQATIVKG